MLELYIKKINIDTGEKPPVTEEIVPKILSEPDVEGGIPGGSFDRESDPSRDEAPAEIGVERTEHGKPFIKGSDLEFSVTHSDDIWMIALSDAPIGIDFQYIEDRNVTEIAKRFYPEKDFQAVSGSDDPIGTFFDIWVRREALAKYTGEGFFRTDVDLSDGDKALPGVTVGKAELSFTELTEADLSVRGIEPGRPFRCVICEQMA